MKLKNIKPVIISKYYKELFNEGLTEEYIQYIHSILKSTSKSAVDWKYLKNNFIENVKAPKRKKEKG